MKKVYYNLELEQISPLRIGNGKHEESDNDLMLDGRGLPFIPGSSLAGIFRHRAIENGLSEKTERRLFGIVVSPEKNGEESVIESSAILFGDAVLGKETSTVDVILGRRDGVGLNEWGTAKRTSKFDFQIAETDRKFFSVIEWTGDEGQYKTEIKDIIEPILKHYIVDGIKVGAKTSRGYGNLKVEVKKVAFDFPNDLENWIKFNPYAQDAFENADFLEGELGSFGNKIEIGFKIVSPFSIRVNIARKEILEEDGSVPDTIPMENFRGNPVIPGTAWAGAFRHHMHALLRDTGSLESSEEMRILDALFGIGGNSSSLGKSKITFSETEILLKNKKEQKTLVMRTAIDRFTAMPKNAALFTNMVYSGGNGVLNITFDRKNMNDKDLELLAACICDLHLGIVSLGGEASIGRGIMRVTELKYNGVDKMNAMLDSIEGKPLDWLKEEAKNV